MGIHTGSMVYVCTQRDPYGPIIVVDRQGKDKQLIAGTNRETLMQTIKNAADSTDASFATGFFVSDC